MQTLKSLTVASSFALLALSATPSPAQDSIGWPYLSELHPGESTLASLTYMFQGFPEGVFGVQFMYQNKAGMVYDRYLSKLLSSPTPAQRALRDCAFFFSTRIYIDDKSQPYLVLSEHDALKLYGDLYYSIKPEKLSHNDRLLRNALLAYSRLQRDPSAALPEWMASKGDVNGPVESNVRQLLQKIVVTDRIDPSWETPSIWR